MAEQKAWVMAGRQTQWKLVVINPSMVMAPGLNETSALFQNDSKLGRQWEPGQYWCTAISHECRRRAKCRGGTRGGRPCTPRRGTVHLQWYQYTDMVAMGQAIATKFPPPKYPVTNKGHAVAQICLFGYSPRASRP